MKFKKLPLKDSYLIELKPFKDKRGSFSRFFCKDTFKKNKLSYNFKQINFSENYKKGTFRGLHQQISPYEEVKLIYCTKGKIYDVIVDNRKKSNTYLKWFGITLTEKDFNILYVPKGFLHGYLTLTKYSAVNYLVSTNYNPKFEFGCRYDDPSLKIKLPLKVSVISEKDLSWKDLIKIHN